MSITDNRFYIDRYDELEMIEHLASMQREDEAKEAVAREIRLHRDLMPVGETAWRYSRGCECKSAEYVEWCEFDRLLLRLQSEIPRMAGSALARMSPSQRDRVAVFNNFFHPIVF